MAKRTDERDRSDMHRERPVRRPPERRHLAVALALASIAILLCSLLWTPPIMLLWNASSSAPRGLYRLGPAAGASRGDMVAAWAPQPARLLADQRHYLPAEVPLVKRIAAAGGDRICARRGSIFINDRLAGRRMSRDRLGRRMPRWIGCRRLHGGEYLLLMDSPLSFDGRYFGATRQGELIGRAVLLWRQ